MPHLIAALRQIALGILLPIHRSAINLWQSMLLAFNFPARNHSFFVFLLKELLSFLPIASIDQNFIISLLPGVSKILLALGVVLHSPDSCTASALPTGTPYLLINACFFLSALWCVSLDPLLPIVLGEKKNLIPDCWRFWEIDSCFEHWRLHSALNEVGKRTTAATTVVEDSPIENSGSFWCFSTALKYLFPNLAKRFMFYIFAKCLSSKNSVL